MIKALCIFLRFSGKYDLLLRQMDLLDTEIQNVIKGIPSVISVAKKDIFKSRTDANWALIGSAIGIATGYLIQVKRIKKLNFITILLDVFW